MPHYKTQTELNEALYWAVKSGNLHDIVELLNQGADIDAPAVADWTPLAHAADLGLLDVVKLLLERNANPDLCDQQGFPAIHWAKERGYKEIEALLLAKTKTSAS